MRTRIFCSVFAMAAAALTISEGAPAEGASGASDATASNSDSLETVVVTARRVEENEQKVPITLTVVSPQELRDANVDTGLDLQKLIPSLSTGQSPATTGITYSLRGIRGGFNPG